VCYWRQVVEAAVRTTLPSNDPMNLKALVVLAAIPLVFASKANSQNAPLDPRRVPPTEQLGRLASFLGAYSTTMEQLNRVVSGTMEMKLVVKGFYIERVNVGKTDDGKVDSEIRSLITWDPALGKYRIWRFVPLTPQRQHDGLAWFEGDEFVEEYPIEDSPTGQKTLRNRTTVTRPDELRIINEIDYTDGRTVVRGVITAKRVRP
jgi:hypothetical protein